MSVGQGENGQGQSRSHGRIAGKMVLLAFGMFGFGYLMVPLYDIICDVTGLNGKTGRVSASTVVPVVAADEREIIVEFVASINQGGSWVFEPSVKSMTVNPGQLYNTSYYAENLTDKTVVAQATPSVSPFAAARYFNKTECFCFTRQEFEPRGSRDMPLTFIIDPDIPVNVDRVTLSYTFFKSPDQS
jgi:cytochrome c oxidase assembly protein subunit 11